MSCAVDQNAPTCQVIYAAPQIAGEEQITAILKQGSTEVERQTATMRVRVPGLEALTGSAFGIWRLTGQTGRHSSNHYGTPYANARIQAMATVYFDLYGESLGVNDMNLSGGASSIIKRHGPRRMTAIGPARASISIAVRTRWSGKTS